MPFPELQAREGTGLRGACRGRSTIQAFSRASSPSASSNVSRSARQRPRPSRTGRRASRVAPAGACDAAAAIMTGGRVMTDIRTTRLQLHAIDVAEADRIVAQRAGPNDVWAERLPFEGDVGAAGMFLHASATHGEQSPFGYYRSPACRTGRRSEGRFQGRRTRLRRDRLRAGPSARGNGYAAEAVSPLRGRRPRSSK